MDIGIGLENDDERLVQMVQDFIESSDSSYTTTPTSCAAANVDGHHSKYLALKEMLEEEETGSEAGVLRSVVKLIRRRMLRKGCSSTSTTTSIPSSSSGLKKWLVLGLQMEGYLASLCRTSWVTSLGCPGGDYEYIDILIRDDDNDQSAAAHRLIVDIDFKSQFEVARPTRTYAQLTDALPTVFVGTESKLNRIITILCCAAKQSLTERGLHIPPWRTATYMQSKWLSPIGSAPAAKCHPISSSSSSRSSPPPPQPPLPSRNHSNNSKSKALLRNGIGVKGKTGNLRSGSALSSQFSNMSINCC